MGWLIDWLFDSQLLIEWGADVMKRNKSSKTAFDLMRHYELKKFLEGKYWLCYHS